jgi:hypothetical protein
VIGSKLAVTTADLTSLLRTVEEDQTPVHAAYYTDDECIARIADWIAGDLTSARKEFARAQLVGAWIDDPKKNPR